MKIVDITGAVMYETTMPQDHEHDHEDDAEVGDSEEESESGSITAHPFHPEAAAAILGAVAWTMVGHLFL